MPRARPGGGGAPGTATVPLMLSLLALASSLSWGTADFFAGLRSRQMAAAGVVAWSQAVGLAAATAVVVAQWLAAGPGASLTGDWRAWAGWAAAAGASGMTGLVCYYAALSSGTMGVVAPVASLGVIVPVVLGLLRGDQPAATAWAGMLVAITGVALASGPELSGEVSARPVALAAVAAGGFGLALYCLDGGARASLTHTLWGMRLTSVAVFALAGLALRRTGGLRPRHVPALVLIGLGDLTANGLFAFASSHGLVSVSSVLGSLYPVATVLLARFLLAERLRPVQSAGVAISVVGVALIAL
jgi:drug/metabolite transporter (DMT)-like permease